MVNAALALLYWQVEDRILREVLREKRAEYGAEIVATLARQLGWSHFEEIIPLKDELKRDFYAEMCRVERWSVLRGAGHSDGENSIAIRLGRRFKG